MTAVEARARVPDLELRDEDRSRMQAALEATAEVLLAFSSLVEVVSPDLIVLEIGRSARFLATGSSESAPLPDEAAIAQAIARGIERFGHTATIAIADDVDSARTLVEHTSRMIREESALRRKKTKHEPIALAQPDHTDQALSTLPISALVWTDPGADPEGKLHERLETAAASLRLLGVRDVGHLATFPAAQVAARFGDAGALLMARAQGRRRRPLKPFEPAQSMIESVELEQATADLEPISFLLKRMLDRLEARLSARGLSASALELAFTLDTLRTPGGSRRRSAAAISRLKVQLARPTRSARTFLRLCRERVQGALPDEVRAIAIEAITPVPDRGAQLDLFNQQAERVEKVEELIARLQANLGEQAVFSAELADTHRPEAGWVAKPFEIEAAFTEPAFDRPRSVNGRAKNESLARARPRKDYTLPEAKDDLAVLGASTSASSAAITDRPWPKPVQRKKEHEPLPPLPPRPLELFADPEPAELEEQILRWRGERHPIRDLGRRERFECEWWRLSPLAREYAVIELEDGRRLWAFHSLVEPIGLWIHGLFD